MSKSAPEYYSSDVPTNSYLRINNCGTLLLNDKDYHIIRPNGRKDYLLIYIAKGKGYVTIDNKEHIIREKQAFIFHPAEVQNYHFFKKDNAITYWIHFNGTHCNDLIDSLNLDKINILKLNIDRVDIEQLLYRLCHEFSQKNPFYEQICSGLLITILGLMSRCVSTQKFINKPNNLIEQIIGDIHANPQETFVINDIAKKFSISANHLIREFKKTTGLTPSQYMIEFRLKKAQELLRFSTYSLNEISELLGYQSYSYFSRIFKKHIGISPIDFRSNNHKNKDI